jgi:superfamily II DNA helicase RecQ
MMIHNEIDSAALSSINAAVQKKKSKSEDAKAQNDKKKSDSDKSKSSKNSKDKKDDTKSEDKKKVKRKNTPPKGVTADQWAEQQRDKTPQYADGMCSHCGIGAHAAKAYFYLQKDTFDGFEPDDSEKTTTSAQI